MKKILALATLLFLCSIATAADPTFYGAWWTTWHNIKGTSKGAGQCDIQINGDINNVAGIGNVTVTILVDAAGHGTSFSGMWTRITPNVVSFWAFGTDSSTTIPKFTGRFYVASGQCSGTWRNSRAHGRFQTERQP